MLNAALNLASKGWPVFPCWWTGERAKAPMTKTGFKAATTDPEQIRYWWERAPLALIGGALPNHLIVLDIDPHNGGTLEELEERLGPLPPTLTVWSGRGDGGRHLYYQRPGLDLTSTALPAGVDLRIGGRHYLIMPPSLHPLTGKPYVAEGRPVSQLTPAAALKLRRPERTRAPGVMSSETARNGLLAFVAGAPEGERNSRLFWAACRASETNDALALEGLRRAAATAGLSDIETERTIRSAYRESSGNEESTRRYASE